MKKKSIKKPIKKQQPKRVVPCWDSKASLMSDVKKIVAESINDATVSAVAAVETAGDRLVDNMMDQIQANMEGLIDEAYADGFEDGKQHQRQKNFHHEYDMQ